MNKPFALIAIVALSGCASQQLWYLNGQSEAQFRKAETVCQRYSQRFYNEYAANRTGYYAAKTDSYAAAAGAAVAQASIIQGAYNDCMEGHGFTQAD